MGQRHGRVHVSYSAVGVGVRVEEDLHRDRAGMKIHHYLSQKVGDDQLLSDCQHLLQR